MHQCLTLIVIFDNKLYTVDNKWEGKWTIFTIYQNNWKKLQNPIINVTIFITRYLNYFQIILVFSMLFTGITKFRVFNCFLIYIENILTKSNNNLIM